MAWFWTRFSASNERSSLHALLLFHLFLVQLLKTLGLDSLVIFIRRAALYPRQSGTWSLSPWHLRCLRRLHFLYVFHQIGWVLTHASIGPRRLETLHHRILIDLPWYFSILWARWCILFLILIFIFYPVEPNSQIFGTVAYVIELFQNQLDLFREFACARSRSELNCLYKCALKLLIKLMSSFDFKHIITKRNQIGDSLHLQFLSTFKKRSYFPFLILSWKIFLVLRPRGYNLDILPENLGSFGHEPLCAQLNPAFGGIRDDENSPIIFWYLY